MRLSVLAFALQLHSLRAAAAGPYVKLGYATYEGTALSNGVDQYLGMRYAAPPIGSKRFRAPEPPLNETGVVQAKEHGNICYGVQGLAFGSLPITASEDCLFIDVYAPNNTTRSSGNGFPVMLWIQGGAFVQLFNPNYNGTGLVEASGGNAIVVTFNYRVGPYGFLASTELQQENSLNVGLRDQRAAISWVQNNIHQFGGDPDKVTLFGTSIGGGSVLLQTLAYAGQPPSSDTARWSAGIAQAVNIPSVYEVQDLQFQYDHLLNLTNCTNLDCLRSLDSDVLQAANVALPYAGQSSVPLFPYGPVVDGSFFTSHPQDMIKAGNFSKQRPLIIGSSHSEGTLFVPAANTSHDVNGFLRTQYPDLDCADLAAANQLYSTVPETYPGVTVAESSLFYRLAHIYGDAAFSCPALAFASHLSAAGAPVRLFRTNIIDPVEFAAGYLVPHTWELQAVWGPEYATSYVALPGADSYNVAGVNRPSVEEVQKYWLSFAATLGDPNAQRQSSAPEWPVYGAGVRLVLETNATRTEEVPQDELERCAFWSDIASRTHT